MMSRNFTYKISGCFLRKWAFYFMFAWIASHLAIQPEQVTVYLVGDSTMSEKKVTAFPETGWGMYFSDFFEENVKIENHARNGRSTRSFIEEGSWDLIVQNLKKDDYVFMQFGHNDEVQTKPRSTTPEEFQKYLRQYINDTKAKEAHPVVLTPITRRQFDEEGKVKETHKKYSQLMREVAETEEVPLIDMDQKSRELLAELGQSASTLLYLHLKPGQHPNYRQGLIDNTHFSETGARMMAELVLQGIIDSGLELEKYIVNRLKE